MQLRIFSTCFCFLLFFQFLFFPPFSVFFFYQFLVFVMFLVLFLPIISVSFSPNFCLFSDNFCLFFSHFFVFSHFFFPPISVSFSLQFLSHFISQFLSPFSLSISVSLSPTFCLISPFCLIFLTISVSFSPHNFCFFFSPCFFVFSHFFFLSISLPFPPFLFSPI